MSQMAQTFAHVDAFRPNGYYLPPDLTEENYRPALEVLCAMVEGKASRPEVKELLEDALEVSAPQDEVKSHP